MNRRPRRAQRENSILCVLCELLLKTVGSSFQCGPAGDCEQEGAESAENNANPLRPLRTPVNPRRDGPGGKRTGLRDPGRRRNLFIRTVPSRAHLRFDPIGSCADPINPFADPNRPFAVSFETFLDRLGTFQGSKPQEKGKTGSTGGGGDP